MMSRTLSILLLSALALSLLPGRASAQQYSVSTNIVGWADLGTANLEAGAALSRHFTLHAGFRYNPWTIRPVPRAAIDALVDGPVPAAQEEFERQDQLQNRKQAYHAGIRWWPWYVYSGWWVGARGQWMEYNRGGIVSPATEEGEALGAGLSVGYTRMIHRNWNIEFGLGLWGGTTRYTTYACPTCGTVRDSGTKTFILPDDVMLSVIFIF